MKTWWNYAPALVLAFLLPFVAGALPTMEFHGHFYGGGVVREMAINQVAQWLPLDVGRTYISAFSKATAADEYFLYLPIALNAATLLVIALSGFYSIVIRFSNWIEHKTYQSQRQASKGA